MRIVITRNDLEAGQDLSSGLTHPIARALHRDIGSCWKVIGNRVAYEVFPPFRVVPLPESAPLYMKAWRKRVVVPPFEFEIPDQFDIEAP